jgi:7-cyano-7-deazaguanine synthase
MLAGEPPMRCVAIISGGPDSISYAAQWRERGYEIYPIIFDYGQKARREIAVAVNLSQKLGFRDPIIVDISSMRRIWRGTQLTDESVEIEEVYKPNVVVPMRNVIFLAISSAYALTIGANVIIYGAQLDDISKTDSGDPLYPDCHPDTTIAFEDLLKVAHFPVGEKKLEIWSPAREGLSKSENLRRGYEIIKDLIYETWSCYKNGERHCGKCESCINRRRTFLEAGIPDKTEYEVIQ